MSSCPSFEGGTRVVGFLSGGYLPTIMRGKTVSGMMHVADWYVVKDYPEQDDNERAFVIVTITLSLSPSPPLASASYVFPVLSPLKHFSFLF